MEALEREGEEDQERYDNVMAAIAKATDAATTVKERFQRRSEDLNVSLRLPALFKTSTQGLLINSILLIN